VKVFIDSASITSIVSKWRPFSFIFNWETEKSMKGGECQPCCFWSKFLVRKEVWDGALSWCNSQFSCSQSSGRSLHRFSHSRRKMS
jgi:hypothetical protein